MSSPHNKAILSKYYQNANDYYRNANDYCLNAYLAFRNEPRNQEDFKEETSSSISFLPTENQLTGFELMKENVLNGGVDHELFFDTVGEYNGEPVKTFVVQVQFDNIDYNYSFSVDIRGDFRINVYLINNEKVLATFGSTFQKSHEANYRFQLDKFINELKENSHPLLKILFIKYT